MSSRIRQQRVAAHFPEQGAVSVMVFGEAPGPLGADKSGIPFWGDRAGKLVYRALERAQLAQVPKAAWSIWDGSQLAGQQLRPQLRGVALSNALDYCPTDDGQKFRSPKPAELLADDNVKRLQREMGRAVDSGARQLLLLALGKKAEQVLRDLATRMRFAVPIRVEAIAHPSAQGPLSSAPNQGKGCALADLGEAWQAKFVALAQTVLER